MKTELKTTISDFTIGLIGGGQLGKMLAIEAQKLGFEVMVLDPDKTAPAMQVVRNTIYGELDDLECLTELLDNNNFITYETENIDIEKLKLLAPKYPEKLNSIIKKVFG
jgi:5-(carboxyamino)imidazole ribonucleotide synthase